jgi:hypothetical protein
MTAGATEHNAPTPDPAKLETVRTAIRTVLRVGLPIRPETAPQPLLELAGVIARSVRPDDCLARVDALDRLLRTEIRRLGLVELRKAAASLFGIGRGGTTLTERRRAAAAEADYEVHHFRKRIEPKIVDQLAWQLQRDALQYIQRRDDGQPFTASGDTPVITDTHIEHPDTAKRQALLSELWSEVYGLRAELIRRESARDDPEQRDQFQDAAAGSLWRLARLLTKLDAYLERYGREILHGSASYNAEGLIRLAGWNGEVTAEQARELRFLLARVGQWERASFAHALKSIEPA